MSGTTVTLCLFEGNKVTSMNLGDSRAVKVSVRTVNGKTECCAQPLTVDHKPELAEERKRILGMNGRIKAFKDS
jgi:serine/threonine protein phosphatase PrpC